MIKDITLGQFFPGDSFLHRLDPRMKILMSVVFIVAVFLAKSAAAYGLLVAFVVVLAAVSQIPLKTILNGMKPILFIVIFTAVINLFWTRGEHLLVEFFFIRIYVESVLHMVYMVIRIVSLLVGTSILLTYTTSPIKLTDGIEPLLSPLKKIGVPVHEFAMMMTIALRFIPTLVEETDKIMNAQKARGADFTGGSLKDRAKALIPVFIPLFVSAFRRADDLATAMECRCYRGGEGRTKMTELHFGKEDFFFAVMMLLFTALIVAINLIIPFGAI